MLTTLHRPMVSARPRPSRQATVVRANLLNDVGAGFTQIFRPLLHGRAVPWPESSFKGKSARKQQRSTDNWSVAPAAQDKDSEPEKPKDEGPLEYMNKAAESVVAHNFKGDTTEPQAWKSEAASIGWKGDIHSRNRSGFHGMSPATQPKKAKGPAEAAPADEEQVDEQGNIVTFLNKAAESVVAHNFTGDKTEPQLWKDQGESSSTGWKGDIHTRKREGFHSIKD